MKRRPPYLLIALLLCACGPGPKPRTQTQEQAPAQSTAVSRPPASSSSDSARAAPALPFTLQELRFDVAGQKLVASAGKRRVVVPTVRRATKARGFRRGEDGRSVIALYQDEFSCGDPDQLLEAKLQLAELAARMLNAEALDAHRAGRFEQAAAGFAAALAQDPSFDLARTNRACALNRLGRAREAIVVLAPLLGANPVLAYSKVALDPDLTGLLSEPEIAALRAPVPGSVEPRHVTGGGPPLVGGAGRWVAVPITEVSWGSGAHRRELAVFDARTGREQLRTTLVEWGDTDEQGEPVPARRAMLQQRLADALRWLRDLGFAPDAKVSAMQASELPGNGRLKRSPLRIKLERYKESGYEAWRYDVWKNQRVVGHFGENVHMNACKLSYSPAARALIAEWTTEASEGCDSGPYTFAALIPTP